MPDLPTAQWILTFDDGPLPSDVTTWTPGHEDDLLNPLRQILDTLRNHPAGPIPAVFFLRGKIYPWGDNPPPDKVFSDGVNAILGDGHYAQLHCNCHDPDLWLNPLRATRFFEIPADLDAGRSYFQPMVPRPLSVFRPPYGAEWPVGLAWALLNNFRWRRWDIDSEDWLHHPDAPPLIRRFVNDPDGHLAHILSPENLPYNIWRYGLIPGACDILLHVNCHTASYLDKIVDCIVETTRDDGREPEFVVPDAYLHP